MKLSVEYSELTPDQKLRAFTDADPVPPEFINEMEAAGFATTRSVEDEDLDDAFAYERGIVAGGWLWELTEAGRTALSEWSQK